jgi:hypothetical protein
MYAVVRTDEHVMGSVRTDSEQVFLEDFFRLIAVNVCRKRYAEERQHPEHVDIGGEA